MKPTRILLGLTVMMLIFFVKNSYSQNVTVTISDQKFIDASVYNDTRPGYEHLADKNYENLTRLSAWAWSHSGKNTYWRTLMYFDLSSIPEGSTINSATLYMYSDPTVTSSSSSNGNSQLSGSNAIYLERIIQEWHSSTVTWNNQPLTTTSGRIWVGPSTSTTENKQVNIKSIVQGWIDNPVSNFGIKMMLENELKYRARNYASTNHSNSAIRPKLIINYTIPTNISPYTCDTPEPTEEEVMGIPWYGSDTYLSEYMDSLTQTMNNSNLRVAGDIEEPYLRIAIRFWVYRESSTSIGGNNFAWYPNEQRIKRMMDDLNDAARNNGLPLRFYIKGITEINSPNSLNADSHSKRTSIANANRDLNAVNVHIVDRGTSGIYHPFYNAVIIPREVGSSETDANTFTHEIGHFFGLLHTHWGFNWPCLREPVTRGKKWTLCPNGIGYSRRCTYTGDLLCDTPADPKLTFGNVSVFPNCTWNLQGIMRDQFSDLYHPDTENYMAYGNHSCRSNFSPLQVAVITRSAFKRQYKSYYKPTTNNAFDRYEPDDEDIAANQIFPNQTQTHTFHADGRRDNVDWLFFNYPNTGSITNYIIKVHNTTLSAVGDVKVHSVSGSTPPYTRVAEIPGITSSTTGRDTYYTIPCSALTPNRNYLIEVIRGGGTNTREYDIELLTESNNNQPITISGSLRLCSQATYTVIDAPTGSSVSWTATPASLFHSSTRSGTGSTAVVRAVSSSAKGSGQINFTIQTGCGSQTLSKLVWIGTPESASNTTIYVPGFYGTNPITLAKGSLYTFQITPAQNATSYNWTLPTGFSFMSGQGTTGSSVKIWTPNTSGSFTLRCSPQNTCGSSGSQTLTINLPGSGGGDPCPDPPCSTPIPQFYPSPADENITLDLNGLEDEISNITAAEGFKNKGIEILIYDENMKIVYENNNVSKKVSIPLAHLPNGIYIAHIISSQKVQNYKFMVSHK